MPPPLLDGFLADDAPQPLTSHAGAKLEGRPMPTRESIKWKGAGDADVQGWLVKPPDFDASTPLATPDTELANGLQNVAINGPQTSQSDGDRPADLNGIWFDTMAEMTDYVMKRWRQDFVTVDIWREEDLEVVAKRPFFLLVSVDAPIRIRWKRFIDRYQDPFLSLSCSLYPLSTLFHSFLAY